MSAERPGTRRFRGRLRRPTLGGTLPLTSLLDVITNLLVFLLVVGDPADTSADVLPPRSSGGEVAARTVTIDVSLRDVRVDGVAVVALVGTEDALALPDGAFADGRIGPLYDRLSRTGRPAGGEILLRCDHRLPFEIVQDVLATAGSAGFEAFRFVVAPEAG